MKIIESFKLYHLSLYCTSLAALLGGCGYEEVHIIEWHSAFFIDSVTVGVIGWELDSKQTTSDWTSSTFSDVDQYFYTYDIPTKKKTLVKKLHNNCDEVAHTNAAEFAYPNVYYTTWYDNGGKIGRYNLETDEVKILTYGGPLSVSRNNKYLITGTGSDYPGRVFNLTTETTIDSFHSFLSPKYVNDITRRIFLFGNEVSFAHKWLLIYDMETSLIDTIGENNYGYYKGSGDYGNVIVYSDRSSGVIQYVYSDSLLSKTDTAITLDYTTNNFIYSFDIDLSTGYYVFYSEGDIVLGKNEQNAEDKVIFAASRTPL